MVVGAVSVVRPEGGMKSNVISLAKLSKRNEKRWCTVIRSNHRIVGITRDPAVVTKTIRDMFGLCREVIMKIEGTVSLEFTHLSLVDIEKFIESDPEITVPDDFLKD